MPGLAAPALGRIISLRKGGVPLVEVLAALPAPDGKNFDIVEMTLRPPGPDELLVRIVACGVCHTDDAMMSPGDMMVLGHEACGVVEAAGGAAEGFEPGDHVVLSYPSCGGCAPCRENRPYGCTRFTELFLGGRLSGADPLKYRSRPVRAFFGQGGFSTHAVVHVSSAVKVDSGLDLKALGPLGCGVQTGAGSVINFLRPSPGDSILILGTGSVGLSAVMAARLLGCDPIIAVDAADARLEMAKELGATHAINPRKTAEGLEKAIRRISGGVGCALDTTGSVGLMDTAVRCMRPGGRGCGVAAAGMPRLGREDVDAGKTWDEIIQGCSVPREFIPRMIEHYLKGEFPFDRMLSFYDFSSINKAFEDFRAHAVIKPVLKMPGAP